jgi:molybdopterin molybdotransferase
MITVEEAKTIVEDKVIPTSQVENRSLQKALNSILAENVHAQINMPPFPQSAMDGYAVNYSGKDYDIELIGEVSAGSAQKFFLEPNQAVRIFTGAEVPSTANMVVRQEDVSVVNKTIKVHVVPGELANIRPVGEQIKKQNLALPVGHRLNEASIGFLASIGVETVSVYKQPKIVVIATGNELALPGQVLKPGQVYDSNSLMLQTALANKGFTNCTIIKIEDCYSTTVNTISEALSHYDLIIGSGGISVGDYDFIGKALEANKVTSHFYKVKQKPGKPLYFGQKNQTYVFGLPGNPAACLTCFYIYVLPFLNKWAGGTYTGLTEFTGYLKKEYTRRGDRAHFLKGKVVNSEIEILDGQSSAMLQSYAFANAIIYVPLQKSHLFAGDAVKYFAI